MCISISHRTTSKTVAVHVAKISSSAKHPTPSSACENPTMNPTIRRLRAESIQDIQDKLSSFDCSDDFPAVPMTPRVTRAACRTPESPPPLIRHASLGQDVEFLPLEYPIPEHLLFPDF
jgi:hypothetical protein